MLVSYGDTPTWRLHTGLCKFGQNISTNIWSLGKRTGLKFAEMSYLLISYNMIIYWLYTLNGFRIIFLWRDSATQEWNLEIRQQSFSFCKSWQIFGWGRWWSVCLVLTLCINSMNVKLCSRLLLLEIYLKWVYLKSLKTVSFPLVFVVDALNK